MTYEGKISEISMNNLTRIFNQLYKEFHFTGRKDKSNSRNYDTYEINSLLNYGFVYRNQRFCTIKECQPVENPS
jgi:hypothetical protein